MKRRLAGRHAKQLRVRHTTNLFTEAGEGRVVALGVADHQGDARGVSRVDHGVALVDRKAHGLFDENVQTSLGGGDRDGCVTARGEDHDRVEWFFQQFTPVAKDRADAVLFGTESRTIG